MLKSLRRVWSIATNTLREAVRNRLLYALLFFAVTMIGFSVFIASLSYVEGERIIQDMGLASIRLFSVGIAIFVGIGLIHGEVERRTIYTILSKPVTRPEFLLGKFLGLLLAVWLQLFLMALAFGLVSLLAGAGLDLGYGEALLLVGIELMVIVAVATLFSAFTTPMLAAFFTVGIYALGHLSRNLHLLGQESDVEVVKYTATLIYRVLPDLESFNLSIQAVHGLPISGAEVGWAVLYGVGYSTALLILASFIFQRRDLQ
ncbi:MAG TPA: ABC transporter permease [Myxococcales bacterium]|jgi:ABC-type transport system involved in multi-copper enzyme maturation permease subunit|nr:ABC transporter permease [Myxococcales bacterium]